MSALIYLYHQLRPQQPLSQNVHHCLQIVFHPISIKYSYINLIILNRFFCYCINPIIIINRPKKIIIPQNIFLFLKQIINAVNFPFRAAVWKQLKEFCLNQSYLIGGSEKYLSLPRSFHKQLKFQALHPYITSSSLMFNNNISSIVCYFFNLIQLMS